MRRAHPVTATTKVLLLSHSAKPSGAELALLRLLPHLPVHRVLIAFAEDGTLPAEFRRLGVTTQVRTATHHLAATHRGDGPLHSARALVQLLGHGREVGRWAEGRDVGVVVARSVKSLLYGAVTARHLGVPLVWSVHDRIAADYFGWVTATTVRALGLALADAYVVNSRATLATLRTGHKPVLLARPAADPATATPPRAYSGTDLGRVVMVGRISPWKGQHVFLEAFERVFAGTATRAEVIGGALFGEGDYEAQLRSSVARGPCSEQITFTGHVDDVAARMCTADVLVHASTLPEPFGVVVSEGMASGCAVVATTPGGPAEVVTDGVDGLLVPCGDVDAMEAALRRLADDPALRRRIAEAGRLTARRQDVGAVATGMARWWTSVSTGQDLPVLVVASDLTSSAQADR